jgi:putative RNA 2'-phosphotransferase
MMNEKNLISTSKFISRVLRHQPELVGITLDENGWADTNALITGMNEANLKVTLDDLKMVVANNNKQRFKFNDDYTKIRANQGHSVQVNVEMAETVPPDILYHGTATRFLDSIKADGLLPQKRLHVHLSGDKETAMKVGQRHGKPVILTINATKMHEDGFVFYLSDNGVWLTSAVPASYIFQF